MSLESRLARMGLLHLKDKPEELEAELERRRLAHEQDQQDAEAARQARLIARAMAMPDPDEPSSTT